MKNLNTKLKAKVKDAFKHNPDAEKLYVTSDGNCFLPNAKQHAVYHAHKNGLKVFEVLKSDLEQKSTGKGKDETSKGTGKENTGKGKDETPEGTGKETTGKGKKETSGGAGEKETGNKTNKGKTPENTGEQTTGKGKDETKKADQ